MGCTASRRAESQRKSTGLHLMTSKLHFQVEQLKALDEYFRELAKRDFEIAGGGDGGGVGAVPADITGIESAVERLVQRLVAGVGNLDRRFSATFLVSLNESRRVKQLRFEYLLRLDALSRPSGQPDLEVAVGVEEDSGLPGFARLRLRTGQPGDWAEFVAADGRLRRDLVKAKLAALLALAIRQDAAAGVDERLCITPGQVVDAEVLDKIFKQPDHCRVFYGSADSKLPEMTNHRIAIVEDENGILLKIGLDGFKSQDIEVRLLIGVSINAWPAYADYPKRVPLYHCDALLHYTAAQSGMYVVAVAPHQGLRCDDRASLWRVRLPAAEVIMRQHYCEESVPALTESSLLHILDQLRGRLPLDFPVKRKGTLRLVSRHIIQAIHWWSLERAGPDPLQSWSAETLAQHVLLSLDELLRALKCQNLRCYFQPRCNLMLQCARGAAVQHEDLYATDTRLLESYLSALHDYSAEWLLSSQRPQKRSLSYSEILEKELVTRWRQVVASLPRGPINEHHGYTARQFQYLGIVVKEVLRAKDSCLQGSFDACSSFFNLSTPDTSQISESTENLIYLLSLVLKQAKDQVHVVSSISSSSCNSSHKKKIKKKKKRHRRNRGSSSRAERKRSCARAFYDRAVELLIDIVKKDRETAYLDLENNTIMAETLVKWLHFGMEEDNRVLGPMLRPYLGNLASCTRELAWHVESWRNRQDSCLAEMRSLGMFCKLVTARELLPANGIVESLTRGWSWAENLARMIERSNNAAAATGGLALVFLTPERILRYQLRFAADKGQPGSYSTWSKARSVGNAVRRASIARASLITATDTLPRLSRRSKTEATAANKGVAVGHVELRDTSPLTLVATMSRRRGRQRGPGGLIPALVSLNKFRVLQEVAQVLPQKERTAMLELVQRVSRESARRQRRASCPDQLNLGEPRQLYTPRSESELYETPATKDLEAPTRQQRLILERQQQLRREILEIHDTLTRGLRSRSQLPAWDSTSMASWASSCGSIGHGKLKRHRTTIWGDTVRGNASLWDSVSCNSTFSRVKSAELLRNDSFLSNRVNNRTPMSNETEDDREEQKLPSWDLLEKTLNNNKFLTYEYVKPNFYDDNKDVNHEYLFISNDIKELPKK